mgnify:CR=1 FL=1
MSESAESTNITLYSRPNCPMNRPVLQVLLAAQARIDYVDIAEDDAARQRVREINEGNESVPTLVFPDGSTLAEPGPRKIRAKLQEMGFEVSAFASWRPYVLAALGNPLVLLIVAVVAIIIRILLGVLGVL